MHEKPLLAELRKQALAMQRSSQGLAELAGRLPKHGSTVAALSHTLRNGSRFLTRISEHVKRDPKAA